MRSDRAHARAHVRAGSGYGAAVHTRALPVWGRHALLAAVAAAALWHAVWYDFFCDDAFIALRYARHLIQHGQLVYNLGQRVEGFTSPLWVLLIAAGGANGSDLTHVTRVLGALSGAGTFWALAWFWDELEPRASRFWALAPAGLLAVSAPFAAWVLGGLETPLFVCLYTLSLAALGRALRDGRVTSAAWAGAITACCTLCRPEGAILIVLGSLALLRPLGRRTLAWLVPIALLVGSYELFRLRYYGFPLPNTFYVKTSGSGLWERGLSYLALAAREIGWPLLAGVALAGALRIARGANAAFVLVSLGAAAVHLLYVARVGGDFLDLYRFLAPLLPAAFCIACTLLGVVYRNTPPQARGLVPAGAAALVLLYGTAQRALALEATQVSAESRRALRLEPLGWTRLYGRRWRGIGAWLSRVRRDGDSTAVGAAGALPFYAGMPNLDLFGLNDLEIARHGRVIGNRPGHQRFASMDYVLAAQPTFLFLSPELTPLQPSRPRADRFWTSRGYVPVQIRVDRELCGCPETFYHQLLVRRERAALLRGREDTVVGAL